MANVHLYLLFLSLAMQEALQVVNAKPSPFPAMLSKPSLHFSPHTYCLLSLSISLSLYLYLHLCRFSLLHNRVFRIVDLLVLSASVDLSYTRCRWHLKRFVEKKEKKRWWEFREQNQELFKKGLKTNLAWLDIERLFQGQFRLTWILQLKKKKEKKKRKRKRKRKELHICVCVWILKAMLVCYTFNFKKNLLV